MASLFVYGSLMSPAILRALLKRPVLSQVAWLEGYERLAVVGERYPAIRPRVGRQAPVLQGCLLQGLTRTQIRTLDSYEGHCYRRIRVGVRLKTGKQQGCDAYVFKSRYYRRLSPEHWDHRAFQQHLSAFQQQMT